MAQNITQARPYARAAYEIAKADNRVSTWLTALQNMALLVQQTIIANYLRNPKVSVEKAVVLFVDILADELDEQNKALLMLLAESRQLTLLTEIASLFAMYYEKDNGLLKVNVCSTIELTFELKKKLTTALQKHLQREIELDCQINPELIGGAVIRTDKWVLDGSVKGRLTQLKTILG